MRIVLCVPVPLRGQRFLQMLVSTAKATCSGRHEIVVQFTCHDAEQRALIIRSGLALPISASHIVPRESRSFPHANSVTHSRCVAALYKDLQGDIAVFCDFDGGFVKAGWDECLVQSLTAGNVDLIGAPYSETNAVSFDLPGGRVRARKYQGKPNLIFIAFDAKKMRARTPAICSFAEDYADPSQNAVRPINTDEESRRCGLPIGSFVHVDTGFFIPELIETHKLSFRLFERHVCNYSVVRWPFLCRVTHPDVLKPEEYWFEGSPFFIHYKKGSRPARAKFRLGGYSAEQFERDIWRYLSRRARVAVSENSISRCGVCKSS